MRRELYQRAILESFVKLNPRWMVRNPVMFVVEVGSVLTTLLWIQALFGRGEAPAAFIGAVTLWLWFTVLFANFAEAVAEGRGKAQAEALRRTRHQTQAKKLTQPVDAASMSMREHPETSGNGTDPNAAAKRPAYKYETFPRLRCVVAMSSWSRPATPSRPTARWSSALRRWTKARSPARARR